jgi:hypothetical protein
MQAVVGAVRKLLLVLVAPVETAEEAVVVWVAGATAKTQHIMEVEEVERMPIPLVIKDMEVLDTKESLLFPFPCIHHLTCTKTY